MSQLYSNKKVIFILIFPTLLLFALFVPIPTIALLYGSLCKWDILTPMEFVGLKNYKFLFSEDMFFWTAMKNNVIWLVGGLFLQIIPAFLIALLLSGRIKFKNFFRNIAFLPVALSSTAVSLIWYFVYHGKVGIVNQLIRLFGFENFDKAWLMDQNIALFCILVAVAWQWIGYYMVMLLSGIAQIPEEIIESSRIDGASKWQICRYITIPYLKPIFKVTIVLATVSSFKGFDLVYVMTGGGPNHATDLLALQMYEKSFSSGMYGYGSAIGVVIMLLCMASSAGINYLFRNKSEGQGA